MKNRLRRLGGPLAAVVALALVTLSPGTAFAADNNPSDPLTDVVGQVQQQVANLTQRPAPALGGSSTTASEPSSNPPAPSSDDDLPGNETTDPEAPDHGSANLLEATVAGQDLADVGNNNATVNDDDSTKADSTLLAIGGQEILGTHADSSGTNESHFGDPLAPVCEGSGGAVCLEVLYADAFATDNGMTSHSKSQSGLANACIGGTNTDPSGSCAAPIGLGVATSNGQADRNQTSGRTTAGSESDLANLCIIPGLTGCALGVDALHSEGQSDSGGSRATASRSSYLLGVDANGQSVGRIDEPTAIAVQPNCVSPSALCAYLNQGETYLGNGIAGHAQDALKATVLPGTPATVFAGASHTETLVHNDGGNGPDDNGGNGTVSPPRAGQGGPGHPGASGGDGIGDAVAGVLPNTGGFWSGLLALGLLSIAAGAFTMAFGRRRGAQPA